MTNDNTKDEILQDIYLDHKGRTRERPWREKKQRSLQLVESYVRTEYIPYADRVRCCAEVLQFRRDNQTGKLRLSAGFFCHVRLCPMCQWRRSLKLFCQVSKVMDEVERRAPNLRPVFLTLTVKNCQREELAETIQHILRSWADLTEYRDFRDQIHGWFRALEVNHNDERNDYHPHIHCVLLVDKQYFKPENKKYIGHEKWIHLWRVSAKLDYDPSVYIRGIGKRKGVYKTVAEIKKAVAEVAKYVTKDTDYLKTSKTMTDEVTQTLTEALYRRRLYAFGGIMKVVAKELGAEKPDEGDLVHIDDETVREDVSNAIIDYGWNVGASNYTRKTRQ